MPNWIPRKNILLVIDRAIRATDYSTRVFSVTGEAGEGKTILLRQVGQLLGSPDGIVARFPWSGLLDLYHSDVNTPSGLETRISQAFDAHGEFQRYRAERDDYTSRREAGIADTELEVERARLADVFAECLNEVTLHRRVVIALDTVERMQYDQDEIQELCELEDQSTTVLPWLLDQIPRWRNCVVILSGRSDSRLERVLKDLSDAPNVRYEHRKLGEFDKEETEDYFEAVKDQFPAVSELDAEFRRRLGEWTKGRPIRLELALEVVQHQLGFDRMRQELEALPVAEAQKRIEEMLIINVMNGEPDPSVRNLLRFLATARKGLNAELLHYLAGDWDLDLCQQRLDEIAPRAFIKHRPDDGRIFLHDEMYDLCDRYAPADVQALSGRLAEWYDERITEIDGQLKALGSSRETEDRRKDLQDGRKALQVESLLYHLRADPRKGYERYIRQADDAIQAVEVGLDMRLRNELLAFLQSKSPIDRRILPPDSRLRKEVACGFGPQWAKRYSMRGQNEKAVAVAEKVLAASAPCRYDDPGFRLILADLTVRHAEALIYLGHNEAAVDLLRPTIEELEGARRPEDLAEQEPRTYAGWRRNQILGRGHNNLGFAFYSQGHYRLALQEYRSALPYFRASDLLEETANTSNNMGRVYAALYRRSHAESLIEDSLELRQQLGREYRVALSLMTRAYAHLSFGEPHRARSMAERALSICESLQTQRGIAQASLVLGRSLRQVGALWASGVYEPAASKKLFGEAKRNLERAIAIYEKQVARPVRLIEAHNEMGCTYREWSALERNASPESGLARGLASRAIQDLITSIRLAEKHQQFVLLGDSCEDLAQVYFQRGDYDNTDVWLNRAEEVVEARYKIEAGVGLSDIPLDECVEEFWQLMGKIELQRGHLAYERGLLEGQGKVPRSAVEQMTQHYAFAAAYFEQYSERAVRLENTFKQVYSRFKHCKIEDLHYVQAQLLPALKDNYRLDPAALTEFFGDTLGLVAPV